jgi:peptide/nickel transport system permease protein
MPRLLLAGAALAALLALAALAGPWLAAPPNRTDLDGRFEVPSSAHPLGTDELGRDVLARLLGGARLSLSVSAAVVALSCALGAMAGGCAAFRGGWPDELLQRLVEILMAFPGILLVIALSAVLGPGLGHTVLALSATGWVGFARLMRAQVLRLKAMEFCEAARALGAPPSRVLFRHVFPQALSPLVVQASLSMAGVVMAESALSFLGLGLAPPAPSWGGMLSSAREHMQTAPHMMLFPTLALASAAASFYMMGEGLRQWLDPRSRQSFLD